MTTKAALLPSGNEQIRPSIAGIPITPQLALWQDVWVKCVTEDSEDENPQYCLKPAKVAGIRWEKNWQTWGVFLFYPIRPFTWLPDNWFDTQLTPIDEVRPMT